MRGYDDLDVVIQRYEEAQEALNGKLFEIAA